MNCVDLHCSLFWMYHVSIAQRPLIHQSLLLMPGHKSVIWHPEICYLAFWNLLFSILKSVIWHPEICYLASRNLLFGILKSVWPRGSHFLVKLINWWFRCIQFPASCWLDWFCHVVCCSFTLWFCLKRCTQRFCVRSCSVYAPVLCTLLFMNVWTWLDVRCEWLVLSGGG